MESNTPKLKLYSASDLEAAGKKLFKSALKFLTQIVPGKEVSGRVGGIIGGSAWHPKKLRKPIDLTIIPFETVRNNIIQQLPVSPDCQFVFCDEQISTYPREVFLSFMELFSMKPQSYVPEQYDCDDFSMNFAAAARNWHAKLRFVVSAERDAIASARDDDSDDDASAASAAGRIGGAPVGMLHGRLSADSEMHAFNFWMAPNGEIILVEPQTCEFIRLGAGAEIKMVFI